MDSMVQASFFSRIYGWFDLRVNPILLKDIRISIRSNMFIGLFFIGLLIAQYLTITFVFFANERSTNAGNNLFMVLMTGIGFILGGILPFITHSRFSEELLSRSTELVIGSGLSAGELIRGKIFCALILTLLFFAAVTPSITISYLIGGVSLYMMLYIPAVLLWFSVVANVLAVLLVSVSGKKKTHIFGLGLFLCGFYVACMVQIICDDVINTNSFKNPEFWAVNGYILFISIGVLFFLYNVAVNRHSFENDNRDFMPRLSLLILTSFVFISTLLIPFFIGTRYKHLSTEYLAYASITALITFSAGILFISNTPDIPSQRVLNNWTKSRFAGLFLYPGKGRLYLYILFVYFLFGVCSAIIEIFPYTNRHMFFLPAMALCGLSFLFTGFLFHRLFVRIFKKWSKSFTAGICIVLSNVLWIAVVFGVYFFANAFGSHRSSEFVLMFSPITGFGVLLGSGSSARGLYAGIVVINIVILVPCFLMIARTIKKDFYQTLTLRKETIKKNKEPNDT